MSDLVIGAYFIAIAALGASLWTLLDRKRHEKRLNDGLNDALRKQEGMRKACGLCGESTRDEEDRPTSIRKIEATGWLGKATNVVRVHDECWEAYKPNSNKVEVTA